MFISFSVTHNGLHDLICFRLRYVRLSSYWTRQILNLSTGDSVNERVIQAVIPMLTVVSPLTALKNYQINSCERLALKCWKKVGGKHTPIRHIRPGFKTVSWQHAAHAQ